MSGIWRPLHRRCNQQGLRHRYPGRYTGGFLAMAAMQSLWPAFIGAALCTGVVFSLFDPAQTNGLPYFFPSSTEGIYTATFFLLWLANTVGCLATWYLAGGRDNKNQR